jgi:uncharacterized protein (TIGR02680 family)
MSLPAPSPGRFKPLRCGLVELFLYEAQEFWFRDGRLLLRGDNGSGKSKVLALTLPLLLDANLSPVRMEPDADPHKRMAWNLLMGDEYDERTGYSWVEFGRVDEHGVEQFVTLGFGAKAVHQKGLVKQWWFLTDQRVGDDLHLVDRTRTVRTRERLDEAIGERGAVFDTAERYRRAVDEALFGLHERYPALVDLLVQLRQPQLSKRPDERLLANALSQALPPMPDSIIEAVAQSYQSLEDEERAVTALRAAAAAVHAFRGEHERYARMVAAAATAGPREAQSEYEKQNRLAREAQERATNARTALRDAEAGVAEARTALAKLDGEREAVQQRLRSDDIAAYTAAREAANAAREYAELAGRKAADARGAWERAVARLEELRADHKARLAEHDEALGEARAGAATLGVELPFETPDELVAAGEREIARRRVHLEHLSRLIDARKTADVAHRRAQRALDEATTRLEAADMRMRERQDAASTAARSWLDRSREHLVRTSELRDGELAESGLDTALERATAWAAIPDDEINPLQRWADALKQELDGDLARRDGELGAEAARLDAANTELIAEIATLDAGGIRRPRAPHTRTRERDGLPGAAFWECVDVRAGLPHHIAAGLEAALEAAGILDAWVSADGSLTTLEGDLLLRPDPRDGATIAEALEPADVDGVSREAIAALLRSIGLDDAPRPGQIAVSGEGAFALGPLVGSWSKPAAQYLGASAREAARQARLTAAHAEHDALATQLAEVDDARRTIARRRSVLEDERAGVPSDGEVRRTSQAAASAAEHRAEANDDLTARRADFEQAAAALGVAADELGHAERLYDLDAETVDVMQAALDALPSGVERVVRSAGHLAELAQRVTVGEEEADATHDSAQTAERHAGSAAESAVTAASRRDALEATVGMEVRELTGRLSALEADLEQAKEHVRAREQARDAAVREDGRAEEALAGVDAAVASATSARENAAEAFRHFATTGLLAVAVPELQLPDASAPWAPDPTVRLARRALEALGGQDVAADALDRGVTRLRSAFETLQSTLSVQGRQAAWDQREGVAVVTIQHGSEFIAPELLDAELAEELGERELLLTARERAILETHLIDEVGAQLHDRVRGAAQQVQRMNDELARRPTRSGLKLRIAWEPADGELEKAGRALLQKSDAAWSPADREAVGDFLRSRITEARAQDPDGSWHERLTRAFDYREWNRFSVQLHQNGVWRPASGPASGGERVLAASVPLFAAAASHYASAANPNAPRLILLDEAFAGVDDRSRASYLGLLTEFDLDVVMTSEREWATYPEIPGIAIANLFRLPDTPAIHVEHWSWDGVARERVGEPAMSAIETTAPTPPDPSEFALDIDGLE